MKIKWHKDKFAQITVLHMSKKRKKILKKKLLTTSTQSTHLLGKCSAVCCEYQHRDALSPVIKKKFT